MGKTLTNAGGTVPQLLDNRFRHKSERAETLMRKLLAHIGIRIRGCRIPAPKQPQITTRKKPGSCAHT